MKARKDYLYAKVNRDRFTKEEYSSRKQAYKQIGTKRKLGEKEFNVKQAEWERDKAKQRLHKFSGLDNVPVSLISPKAARIGKAAAKTALSIGMTYSSAVLGAQNMKNAIEFINGSLWASVHYKTSPVGRLVARY